MSRTIQLRNIPDDLHRILKVRASEAGMSLAEYLLAEIREIAEYPTLSEVKRRVELRQPVGLPMPAAAVVRWAPCQVSGPSEKCKKWRF